MQFTMRLLTKLAVIGSTVASLALPASAAFASTNDGGGNYGGCGTCSQQDPGQYGNQYGNTQGYYGNSQGNDCYGNGGYNNQPGSRLYDPTPIRCLPYCRDEVKWVRTARWTWSDGRWCRTWKWTREYVSVCDYRTTGYHQPNCGCNGYQQDGGYLNNGGYQNNGGYLNNRGSTPVVKGLA